MANQPVSLDEALEKFDRSTLKEYLQHAEEQRGAILKRFPLKKWPEMALSQYALGQEDSEETFCRWLEFRSLNLGSIRGGSAEKLLLYKRKDGTGWYHNEEFNDEKEAWDAIRQGFVDAFAKAQGGDWNSIDEIQSLYSGPALRLKALHVYFPSEIVPIYSKTHLDHYLARLGCSGTYDSSWWGVRLNRFLLEVLRKDTRFNGWTTNEMERFLYSWADPRESRRIVKIAPGEVGRYWDECREGGYICVGWDEIGDLTKFENKEAFRAAFDEVFATEYASQAKRTEKAKELWTLRELEPGDLVVANKGISQILALGEVIEPAYEFRPDRNEYQHTVRVDWDLSYATEVSPQKRWAFVTVQDLPISLYEAIAKGPGVGTPTPVAPLYREIATALERKGQVILYGPPGTGKTYCARRFAVWWLLDRVADPGASAVLSNDDKLHVAEHQLSTTQVSRRVWWIVANPKEWSWDTLKQGKAESYRYGRLKRNYPLVQRGDLVIGYEAAPTKRIVKLARISRPLGTAASDEEPTIEVEYVGDIVHGPSYEEMKVDPVLAKAEPLRFNNQGTLFALTEDEADYLLAMLVDREPSLAPHVQQEGGVGQLTRLTFHASYSYEDFIEGFRPVDTGGDGLTLRLEDGVFKRVCREAQAKPQRTFLVMIDEINRANVAKVLGELITLLERDKRGLTIALPQSKESFAIPENVYLLGTMNTADRSIKLLDAALRRRFAFLEMMPDDALLVGAEVGGLFLSQFLAELNRRIAEHVGREKQIGHSFLLDGDQPVSEPTEFARRFRQEILPLLQEYCYDDYATLARYLGEKLVDAKAQSLNSERLEDAETLLNILKEEFSVGGGNET